MGKYAPDASLLPLKEASFFSLSALIQRNKITLAYYSCILFWQILRVPESPMNFNINWQCCVAFESLLKFADVYSVCSQG